MLLILLLVNEHDEPHEGKSCDDASSSEWVSALSFYKGQIYV